MTSPRSLFAIVLVCMGAAAVAAPVGAPVPPQQHHLQVVFRAFIPDESVTIGPLPGLTFKGDGRPTDDVDCIKGPKHPDASSRLVVDITFTSTPRQRPNVQVLTKTSPSYMKSVDGSYKKIGQAAGDSVHARGFSRPDGTSSFMASGNESLGGLSVAENIGISFAINGGFDSSGRLVSLVIAHDGFPSLELYWKLDDECWKMWHYDSSGSSPVELIGDPDHTDKIIGVAQP